MSSVCIRVRVGQEHYALPVADVREVAELGVVTPVPGAAASVLGVRNLHGDILPVVDLAAVLGLSRDAAPERIVVAERTGRRAGLAVDELEDVAELPESTDPTASRYLQGSVLVDAVLVATVAVDAVLDAVAGPEPSDEA